MLSFKGKVVIGLQVDEKENNKSDLDLFPFSVPADFLHKNKKGV